MSTNGMTSWAVDLADVGAVYPFHGWEVVMTVLCVVFWLYWHVRQMRDETRELEEAVKTATNENMAKGIDRY